MFGKLFASMFTGSMVGAGAIRFAVMSYVIANMKPDRTVGMQVELNPVLLSAILGEKQEDVQAAIDWLCQPDTRSRTKDHDGRRLIKLGEFDYRVVNGKKYRDMRDEEQRRSQNRISQAAKRYRDRFTRAGKPLAGEAEYVAALRAGDEIRAQEILEKYLPKEKPESPAPA